MARCVRCGHGKHVDDYLYQPPGGSGGAVGHCPRYEPVAPVWRRWWNTRMAPR